MHRVSLSCDAATTATRDLPPRQVVHGALQALVFALELRNTSRQQLRLPDSILIDVGASRKPIGHRSSCCSVGLFGYLVRFGSAFNGRTHGRSSRLRPGPARAGGCALAGWPTERRRGRGRGVHLRSPGAQRAGVGGREGMPAVCHRGPRPRRAPGGVRPARQRAARPRPAQRCDGRVSRGSAAPPRRRRAARRVRPQPSDLAGAVARLQGCP